MKHTLQIFSSRRAKSTADNLQLISPLMYVNMRIIFRPGQMNIEFLLNILTFLFELPAGIFNC